MPSKQPTKKLYLRLFHYITPYKLAIFFTILALSITAAMEPVTAYLMKPLLDDSIIQKDREAIIQVPLLIMMVFIIKGLAEYFSKILSEWIAQKAITEIRYDMFRKLNVLPLRTHQKYTSGKLISKLTYDVLQVGNTLSEAWIVIIRDILTILGLFGYLFYISWQLTLMILLAGPILGFIIDRASKMMRSSSTEVQNSMGQVTQALEEGIHAHKDIKIYGAEAYEEAKFYQFTETLRRHSMNVIKVSAANVPLVQVLAAVALSVVLYAISLMSAKDLFTPGELISFIVAAALIFEPIRRLTNINETIQKGMAASESIFELLDQPEEQNTGTKTLSNVLGKIEFKNVTFAYQPQMEPALKNLNICFEAGKTTALVGKSGSGKTTIANLVSRFYDATNGEILLDNENLQSIRLESLRNQIAFVSQDVVLFNDTVRANIAYGQQNQTEEMIIEAAKSAYAWEFIHELPEGLNTYIGDNGSKLSGGQRQRIALARAFLKNAPILVLDEATSALDNQSEIMIQKALEALRINRTVITIAHRLSTIENADNIILIQDGELIESGSHQNLIQQQGHYAELYQQGKLSEA